MDTYLEVSQTARKHRRFVLLQVAIAFGALTLRAETAYFARTNGNWDVAANWSTLQIPTPTGVVYIGSSASGKTNLAVASIIAGDNLSCTNLVLGHNSAAGCGTLNMSGGFLAVSNGGISCGDSGTGIVMQTGGTVINAGALSIGKSSGSTGSWTVAGGTVTNAANVILGNSGVGTMVGDRLGSGLKLDR